MGFNPHKPKSPTKQQFSASLFHDVYRAVEKEYGKDWALAHVANATLYIDDKGIGTLQLAGAAGNFQALVGMLIVRLSHEYALAQIEQAKKEGKKMTVDLKATAKMVLDNAWKKIQTLEDFKQTA